MIQKADKGRGDYVTRGYLAVKELLIQEKGRHLSAEEVYDVLRKRGESIGKTTVYRQLERLLAEGVIRKTIGEGVSCYSFAGSTCEEHYHLFCTACGKLEHLSCERVKELFSHIRAEHGFAVDLSRTTIYGLCAACVRKSKQKEATHARTLA